MLQSHVINRTVVTAMVVLLLSLFGCRPQRTNEMEEQADLVRVGAILGLTGNYAAYGQKMKQGYDVALKELGRAAGKPNISLIVEDSEFDPAKAVSAYHKLTSAQGINLIVGITGSKNAIPVCEAARGASVLIIDPLSSAPKITSACGANYFRIMASDALAGKYNAKWALEEDMKRPSVVYMEDDWGASYRDSVLAALRDSGFDDVPIHGVIAGTRDFRTQVEKLKGNKPDTIFLLLYAKEGSAFMQQLREAKISAAVYGSDNISSSEFVAAGPEVVEGVRVAMPAPAQGPTYASFVSRYRLEFGEIPDANIMKSYDAMMLLAHAVREFGPDPEKIRVGLTSDSFQFEGLSGLIQFDSNGDLKSQDYGRMEYRNGELVSLDETERQDLKNAA